MRTAYPGAAELFPTDEPLGTDAMIGRADDVDRLATTLVGGGNVVVAGARRTGKTSACDAALQVCRSDGCYAAAVDLFFLAGAAELAEELTVQLLGNRTILRRAMHDARRAGRRVTGALSTTASYRARQDLGEDIEFAFDVRVARRDPDRALRSALELAQRLADADDRRVVLFFDEFQEIASGLYGDAKVVTRQMRAIFQRSPRTSVLFAGSVAHLLRDLFAPSDRALSQFGAFYELTPITVDEWEAGLRERYASGGCTIVDSALERLVTAGDQHPRATMLIAQQTYQEARETLDSTIDDALVRTGINRAMRADRLKHEQTLAAIRGVGRYAQPLAQNVARGDEVYQGVGASTAARTLQRLHGAGLLERGTRRGEWSITDPLLRRFLASLVW